MRRLGGILVALLLVLVGTGTALAVAGFHVQGITISGGCNPSGEVTIFNDGPPGSVTFDVYLTYHIPGDPNWYDSGSHQAIHVTLGTGETTTVSYNLSHSGVPADANAVRVENTLDTTKSDSVPPCGLPPTPVPTPPTPVPTPPTPVPTPPTPIPTPPTPVPTPPTPIPTPPTPVPTGTPRPTETPGPPVGSIDYWKGHKDEQGRDVPEEGKCFVTGTDTRCTNGTGWAQAILTGGQSYKVVFQDPDLVKCRVRNEQGESWIERGSGGRIEAEYYVGSGPSGEMVCWNHKPAVATPTTTPVPPLLPKELPKGGSGGLLGESNSSEFPLLPAVTGFGVLLMVTGALVLRRV